MISANLKSNQEALTLSGKLQAMDEERKTHKENSLETKQTDFRNRESKQAGNNRENNRREYNQNVRHITYNQTVRHYLQSNCETLLTINL